MCVCVCVCVCVCMYVYYVLVSVTLGFMHFAFVRLKIFKKEQINMFNFFVYVCLSVSTIER